MALIALILALIPIALPLIPGRPDVPEVQYAHRGPLDPIHLGPGDSAAVALERGQHAGVALDASLGIITPTCPVVTASARVDADGPITATLDRGVRGGNWQPIIDGGPIVPMTAIPLPPGQSIRLRVTNPGPHPVRVSPERTRLDLYAAGCEPARAGQLVFPRDDG